MALYALIQNCPMQNANGIACSLLDGLGDPDDASWFFKFTPVWAQIHVVNKVFVANLGIWLEISLSCNLGEVMNQSILQLGGETMSTSEEFVRQYLRLNGYFCIDNFIVHAGDDPGRITDDGKVGNYTETDILGIRMRYSVEKIGELYIANHAPLTDGINDRVDIVIGEVKTGDDNNKPNKVWKNHEIIRPKEYILKFVGIYNQKKTGSIAKELAENYHYDNKKARIRYIIFSETVNEHYSKMGVTYITYEEIVNFLLDTRGQSWIAGKIGVASIHSQWPPVLKYVFDIANDQELESTVKRKRIKEFLKNNKD